MVHPDPPIDEKYMDYLSTNFEDSLDLDEKNDEPIHLVGLLITEHEPSQIIIK